MKIFWGVFFVALLGFSHSGFSEIKRWTDENGKVHFGDRVPDKYTAQSEDVDVDNANIVKNDRAKESKQYVQKLKREKQYAEPAPAQAPNNGKQEMCSKAAEKYKNLTTVRHSRSPGGRVKTITSTVYQDAEGNEMSRREQNQKADAYRKKMNRLGCSIAKTKNMKL